MKKDFIDFLPIGFYSWRNGGCGSWFIQSFCKVFNASYQRRADFISCLTRVTRRVSVNFESRTVKESETKKASKAEKESERRALAMHQKKQVPCWRSTLLKLIYFEPKVPPAYE